MLTIGTHLKYEFLPNNFIHFETIFSFWFVFLLIYVFLYFYNKNSIINLFSKLIFETTLQINFAQIGNHTNLWLSFIGTIFLFVFFSNWSGALLPSQILTTEIFKCPNLDFNMPLGLALLTSISYFKAGISKSGLNYFSKYIKPIFLLFPINLLEDFTKPLSLSFRLFGNILADELVLQVIIALIPLVIPLPILVLGLFTSGIQALIFATLAGNYIGEALEHD